MKSKINKGDQPDSQTGDEKQTNPPGYPLYPAGEDIYNQGEKVGGINPEGISQIPTSEESMGATNENEKGPDGDSYGGDLDIPGAELDDVQENIGNEDEENNYYSLGGDNHNDLEDQGDA